MPEIFIYDHEPFSTMDRPINKAQIDSMDAATANEWRYAAAVTAAKMLKLPLVPGQVIPVWDETVTVAAEYAARSTDLIFCFAARFFPGDLHARFPGFPKK